MTQLERELRDLEERLHLFNPLLHPHKPKGRKGGGEFAGKGGMKGPPRRPERRPSTPESRGRVMFVGSGKPNASAVKVPEPHERVRFDQETKMWHVYVDGKKTGEAFRSREQAVHHMERVRGKRLQHAVEELEEGLGLFNPLLHPHEPKGRRGGGEFRKVFGKATTKPPEGEFVPGDLVHIKGQPIHGTIVGHLPDGGITVNFKDHQGNWRVEASDIRAGRWQGGEPRDEDRWDELYRANVKRRPLQSGTGGPRYAQLVRGSAEWRKAHPRLAEALDELEEAVGGHLFNKLLHPRAPKGRRGGGRFAEKPGRADPFAKYRRNPAAGTIDVGGVTMTLMPNGMPDFESLNSEELSKVAKEIAPSQNFLAGQLEILAMKKKHEAKAAPIALAAKAAKAAPKGAKAKAVQIAKDAGADVALAFAPADAGPTHPTRSEYRMRAAAAILQAGAEIPDAVLQLPKEDDRRKKWIDQIATGDVAKAQEEYRETPMADLEILSAITVVGHPIAGQAVTNLGARTVTMGSGATGDYRHELGHALRASWSGQGAPMAHTALTDEVAKRHQEALARVKANIAAGKPKPQTEPEWEKVIGIGSPRALDSWEEDFAEAYRIYQRQVFRQTHPEASDHDPEGLKHFREMHPEWARMFDAWYTAQLVGRPGDSSQGRANPPARRSEEDLVSGLVAADVGRANPSAQDRARGLISDEEAVRIARESYKKIRSPGYPGASRTIRDELLGFLDPTLPMRPEQGPAVRAKIAELKAELANVRAYEKEHDLPFRGNPPAADWHGLESGNPVAGRTKVGQAFTVQVHGGPLTGGRANPAASKTALIAVDVQTDFLPGGALGVAHGEEVIPPLVRRSKKVGTTIASGDWHPPEHMSFQAQGGPWPPHAVKGTKGAEIDPRIVKAATGGIVHKGTRKDRDSYSAMSPALAKRLRAQGVENIEVGGLATDYCVKATVLDSLKQGFKVTFLQNASRAVNVHPGDEQAAIDEMRKAGARVRRSPARA